MSKRSLYQKKYKLTENGKNTQFRYYKSNAKKKSNKRNWNKTGRLWSIKNLYGFSAKEYGDLIYKQKNKCAVCGIDFNYSVHGACVDHDHKTNEIRGLLCKKCNFGLGNFDDNILKLQKAIIYLFKFKNKEVDKNE